MTDGIGYYPISQPIQYGKEYFDKYVEYGKTVLGVALTSLRVGLVSRYLNPSDALIDIGIGDGSFIRARGTIQTYGYDVNPVAKEILFGGGLWRDPAVDVCESVSFWDSLEHIQNPEEILNKVQRYCFVSIPVFVDAEHAGKSRHFKPKEHYWYFTRAGLVDLFWRLGFTCLEMNDMETALGREDIGTFVFKRR